MKDTVNTVVDNILLEAMTYETSYEFLEVGKHDNELEEVGKRSGLKLPARDIAIFKGRYALTDKVNRNGCRLPRAEVIASLDTLKGKAVDFDHLRKKVVGYWIDAKLDGNQIISYGAFYKGNFPEEYETIKQLMSEGNLKISFEAYGQREAIEGGTDYNLKGIEFAGGALLLTEKPAEPTATVLELAKVLTAPESFYKGNKPEAVQSDEADKDRGAAKEVKSEKDGKNMAEKMEIARFYMHDMETIMTLIGKLGDYNGVYATDVLKIDFENGKVWVKGVKVNKDGSPETDSDGRVVEKTYEINLTPRSKVIEKASRAITSVTEVKKEEKDKIQEKTEKEVTNMADEAKEKPQNKETIDQKEVETLKAEVAKLQEAVTAKDEEIKSLTEKVHGYEKAETDRKLSERKTQLGEFATENKMTDEDIMDDHKFEVAMKDKEIAALKQAANKANPEQGTVTGLSAGAKDKDANDRIKAAADRVNKYAYNQE